MSLTTPTGRTPGRRPRSAVSVEELQRAWAAVQAGDFRPRPAPQTPTPSQLSRTPRTADNPATSRPDHSADHPAHHPAHHSVGFDGGHPARYGPPLWAPAARERVLPVLGCTGSTGTTTVALAVALAADMPARVVECTSVTTSGLAAASHTELGLNHQGWRQGRRDRVLLERADAALLNPCEVPTPGPAPTADAEESLTVLDGGWDLGQLLAAQCWLHETIRTAPAVIVVAPATVPGLRRLEAALELLGTDRTLAALLGPRPRKWPTAVTHSAGPRTRQLLEQGRFTAIPRDQRLAVTGLDSTPLPPPLLVAAGALLARTGIGATTRSPAAEHSASNHSGRRTP